MNGIKFWCYNAGHVLGAAMFMIEIAGVKVLYTGDFSRIEDRHLMAAEVPTITPDVLITVRLGRRAGAIQGGRIGVVYFSIKVSRSSDHRLVNNSGR